MSYTVNDKERASVLALPARDRYSYFLSKVADWEELWSIGVGQEWVLMADDTATELVPVWPAKEYASSCCTGEWRGQEAKVISLEDWLTKWIPGIRSDGRKVAVFPTLSDLGIVLDPNDLKIDIAKAMAAYE